MTLEQKCKVADVAQHEIAIATLVGRGFDPDTIIALVAQHGVEPVKAALESETALKKLREELNKARG